MPFNGRPSGTAIAFASGQPFFVANTRDHPAVNQAMITATGAASAIWVPVLSDGGSIAVLAVGWREPIAELSAGAGNMLELLAAEAAIAIERAELITQLDSIARTDPLTGAQNRRALTERLADDLDRTRQTHDPLCVVIADLDHFKQFNDTYGHVQGDRLLKEAVASWGAEVRPTDTIARYGGEEFAFVLPGCGLEAAAKLADRLRLRVPSNQTCSLGVAAWQPGESVEELIGRADSALYRAKNGGRNRVEVDARPLAPAKASPDAPEVAGSVSQIVLSTTRRLLGMDLAFLSQIDGDQIIFRDLEGDAAAFGLEIDDHADVSGTFCARMLDGRIDGLVADTSIDPEHATLPVTQDCGIGAYIGAPVELADGRVLGTLCGVRSEAVTMLSDADLSLIRGLAQTIATHIQGLLGPDPSPDDIEAAWQQTVQRISPEPQR
ncbi:MAG: diguanylate cyclase [Patulibacter minatonensis]